MHSRLVPQHEFHSIADADLVVDDAEIIANDMLSHAKLLRYFSILEPLSDQLNYVLLAPTGFAIVFADKYPSLRSSSGRAATPTLGSEGRCGPRDCCRANTKSTLNEEDEFSYFASAHR